jgi:hypothetical protein
MKKKSCTEISSFVILVHITIQIRNLLTNFSLRIIFILENLQINPYLQIRMVKGPNNTIPVDFFKVTTRKDLQTSFLATEYEYLYNT